MRAAKITPQLPPNPLPHLTDWLTEIGLTGSDGMSSRPLAWGEIDAWCRRTCINPSPWESRLIRRLSVAYVGESRRAEDDTVPAPYRTGVVSKAEIQRELAILDAVLG